MDYTKKSIFYLLQQYNKDFYHFGAKIFEQSEVFTFKIPFFQTFHLIAQPNYVKYILLDNWRNFTKPVFGIRALTDLLGEYGIIFAKNYEFWRKERDVLNPQFTNDYVKNYVNSMAKTINVHLDKWEDHFLENKPINLDEFITKIILDIFLKTIFGNINIDFENVSDDIRKIGYYASKYGRIFGILSNTMSPAYRKAKKAVLNLGDDIVEKCISTENDNIIKHIAFHVYNNQISNEVKKHLQQEALVFLSAGYETTSGMVCWAFSYLSLFPEICSKVIAEVKEVVGGRQPTYDDITKLNYTRAVLQETMRLQPSLSVFSRTAVADDSIGKFEIKRNELALVSIYHLHRLAQYWPNPEGFDPDRFLKPLDEKYKFIYMPFGAGPRACLGRNFAFLEAVIILAMVCQRYRLYLTAGSSLEREKTLFDKLNRNVLMTLERI